MNFFSQSGQDEWVINFFKSKKNGFFIEVGAFDGIQTSNTYTLEKYLDWNGICIEANPQVFQNLVKNRKSTNLNVAVNDYNGICQFNVDKISQIGTPIRCNRLIDILIENNCPTNIDYLSLDIEGFEYVALKSFDFSKFNVGLITVEHNSYLEGEKNKNLIFDILTKSNFTRIQNDVVCKDPNPQWYNKPYEDWYVNNNLF